MSREIFLIVGGGCDLVRHVADILDHPGMTAPLEICPPPMTLELKREQLIIPAIEIRRESKKRDWEQRQRKPRQIPRS